MIKNHNFRLIRCDEANSPISQFYVYTYTYSLTDPLTAKVGLNVQFVMKIAKLQYAIRSISKLQIV